MPELTPATPDTPPLSYEAGMEFEMRKAFSLLGAAGRRVTILVRDERLDNGSLLLTNEHLWSEVEAELGEYEFPGDLAEFGPELTGDPLRKVLEAEPFAN